MHCKWHVFLQVALSDTWPWVGWKRLLQSPGVWGSQGAQSLPSPCPVLGTPEQALAEQIYHAGQQAAG